MTQRPEHIGLVDTVNVLLVDENFLSLEGAKVDFVEGLVDGIRNQELLDSRASGRRRLGRRPSKLARNGPNS